MDYITPHFLKKEVACRCCGVANVSGRFMQALEDFRVHIDRPVLLNSVCRCPIHNRIVGGAPKSFHISTAATEACAGDLRIKKMSCFEIMEKLEEWDINNIFTGRGIYPADNFIHLDTGPSRTRVSRWIQNMGTYEYVKTF